MNRIASWTTGLALLGLLGLGCGTAGDDFEAGNRLKITKLTDEGGSTAPIAYTNEETDDSGLDGQAGTGDQGEDDGLPDPGEALITPLSNDIGVLSLENEPRLGVGDEGVDLKVFQVDVTYRDANGNSQPWAPRTSQAVTLRIPNKGTGELQFVLVPLGMKTAVGGLRDIMISGSAAQQRAVSKMTAFVDVYAEDTRNSDTVHEQGQISITFTNPMVAKKAQ